MGRSDIRGAADALKGRLAAYDWAMGWRRCAFALVCAVLCALANVVLCLLVSWVSGLWGGQRWLTALLPLFCAVSVVLYRRLHVSYDLKPGFDDLAVFMAHDERVPTRIGPAMLAGTLLTLLGGGSVGPDAAAKHLGASVGDAVLPWFGLADEDGAPTRDFAVACGLAACFSALLCTPLGVFAYLVEHLHAHGMRIGHLPTVLLSCLVAAGIARPLRQQIYTPFVGARALAMVDVGGAAAVMLGAAVAGTAFAAAVGLIDRFRGRAGIGPMASAVGAAAAVAVALLLVPGLEEWGGIGVDLVVPALTATQPGWGFAAKLLVTAVCLGFGMRGGEVTVMFVAGALLGSSVAAAMGASPLICGALGVVALYAVALRCPVSGVLVGCEFFGWAFCPWIAPCVAGAWLISLGLRRLVRACHFGRTPWVSHGE